MKEKVKKNYEIPLTELVQVEAESGFCAGSVVTDDQQDEPTITIQEQEVGASSDYFNATGSDAGWDY